VPDTITIIDDRTGKKVTVPITDGVFPSSAIRELDPSLFVYDPAYLSTAACRSSITYLDGDNGILRYRDTEPLPEDDPRTRFRGRRR
jgi:citrate synthase